MKKFANMISFAAALLFAAGVVHSAGALNLGACSNSVDFIVHSGDEPDLLCDTPKPVDSANRPAIPPSSDGANTRAALIVYDVFGTAGDLRNLRVGRTALAFVNEGSGNESFSSSDDRFFYPQDTRFMPLPLSLLVSAVVVEPGQQEILLFEIPEINVIPPGLDVQQAYSYYSTPASETPCPEESRLDTARTNCIPFPMDNGECVAFDSNTPIFDDDAPGNCRAIASHADCESVNLMMPYFVDSDGSCRAPESHSECIEINPEEVILGSSVTDPGPCRIALSSLDCGMLLDGRLHFDPEVVGRCRARRSNADCVVASMPILGSDGNCRMPNSHSECVFADQAAPFYDEGDESATPSVSPMCREAMNRAECVESTNSARPIFDDNAPGNCRVPTSAADCVGIDPERPIFNSANNTCGPVPKPDKSGRDAALRYAAGLGVVFFFYAYYAAEGDLDAFSFSPDFGYAVSDSGYSYNYGARLDFAKDNLRMYWTAGQENSDGEFGEFRYVSGGEYRSEFWTAAFSESVQDDTAEYDLALSARYVLSPSANGEFAFGGGKFSSPLNYGVWNVRPVYRFNSRVDLDKQESESRNSLDLEAALQLHRWTIRPSAGFSWRRVEEFGDNVRFRLSAVREF